MPNCLDYVRFLSKAAARRQPSAIREASMCSYILEIYSNNLYSSSIICSITTFDN